MAGSNKRPETDKQSASIQAEPIQAEPIQILPAHLEHSVQSIAKLHANHTRNATGTDRFIAHLTAQFSHPVFISAITLTVVAWIVGNLLAPRMGYVPLDPPPFNWLQGAATVLALYVTILILTVQRRDDQLASRREQMTLQLSIVVEQKVAKVIELLEEMRRDDPHLRNRHDPEAAAMANTADPETVLDKIQQTHDGIMADEETEAGEDKPSPPA